MEAVNSLRNLNADDQFNERVRFFQDFLDRDFGENEYKEKIRKMVAKTGRRLVVNVNAVREYSAEYADGILKTPVDYVPALDRALKDVVTAIDTFPAAKPSYTNNGQISMDDVPFWVGFEGSFGEHFVSPRKMSAKHLGKMVCLEGIVTKCSLVRPKLMKSVHYCDKTEVFHSREYRDGMSLSHAVPTVSAFPKTDDDGNPLTTEYGLCVYRDFQTLTLQEMPERSPAGQLPRPIDVILEDDLVDSAKPGDRIQVGVYRTRGGKGTAATSAITVILANSIRHLGREAQQLTLSDLDIRNIKKIGKRRDLFDLLGHSLAPSIFGHEMIKRAILLLLVGGVEKNLANGTHLRGFVLNTAPLAIATTGRGSSGVGLTAAVTTDKETGERTLEAGAMVLADRGVVCIDEFDKMSDIDRVAIHEVMEQQTVTIAKAGIHTSLNARCSSPHQNIPLPDSLLSRFDLIFVVLDNMGDEHNRMIAGHIIRLHQFTPVGLEEGAPINDNTIAGLYSTLTEAQDDPNRDDVFLKYNKLLHIGIPATGRGQKAKVEILSMPFIKKYIHYVKTRIKPVLSEEARVAIGETYGRLRMEKDGEEEKFRTMPVTPRTLECLIRISSAHAKLRLSSKVEKEDTDAATSILEFALYQKVEKKKRNKRRKVDDGEEEEEGSEIAGWEEGRGDDEDESDVDFCKEYCRGLRGGGLEGSSTRGLQTPRSGRRGTRSSGAASAVPVEETDGMAVGYELDEESDQQTVAIADLVTAMNATLPMSRHFVAEEVIAAVKRLTVEETSFMYEEETAQLILV
ncbi:MCM2/3/5 family-domain-containing protein [Chytridium lagenaria]|nr:MCM2/3/5 family-domain-containing protein [Chytridium lagenaria]